MQLHQTEIDRDFYDSADSRQEIAWAPYARGNTLRRTYCGSTLFVCENGWWHGQWNAKLVPALNIEAAKEAAERWAERQLEKMMRLPEGSLRP